MASRRDRVGGALAWTILLERVVGGLVNGFFNGFGVQYDSAESGIRLIRQSARKKLVAPLKKLPTDDHFHDWRVAKTQRRVVVWLDGNVVASEPAPAGEQHRRPPDRAGPGRSQKPAIRRARRQGSQRAG